MKLAPRRLLISFSGGETSAYMTWWVLTHMAEEYDEIIIVFANTGEENEETLQFILHFEIFFNVRVIWVEAVVHFGERKAPTARVVDYATASRNGEPFEAAIRKYGIPNSKFKNCNRSLKLNPIRAYARSIGWENYSYDTAIGIRADEIDRQSSEADRWRIIYPLIKRAARTKPQINFWWSVQDFRLGIEGYRGNCKSCWKKSFRKLFTIMRREPAAFDFFERMEAEHGQTGPEFEKLGAYPEGYRRTFFRGNKSVSDLRAECASLPEDFQDADDDSIVYDASLDLGGGCEETCEVFADEDMTAEELEDVGV